MTIKTLFPEIEPFSVNELKTDSAHKIYFEQSGNPQGQPVIFLHGGPGSGCNENHRRYFNPEKYRIIIFDQRGCNRSSPQGSIENNTTTDLVNDIESIRKSLGIEQWTIFGGSWGATLGLVYAENFPNHVQGMIFRGSFLARQRDLDWFFKQGANEIFPDYWEDFISVIPEAERNDLVRAYYNKVFSDDENVISGCAEQWTRWATRVVTYSLSMEDKKSKDSTKDHHENNEEESKRKLINDTRIELHYANNNYFLEDNQLLKNINRLPSVPIKIIHGRRDLTCTLQSSWALHESLPGSDLIIIPDAGHLAGEPAMVNALIKATDDMAKLLK